VCPIACPSTAYYPDQIPTNRPGRTLSCFCRRQVENSEEQIGECTVCMEEMEMQQLLATVSTLFSVLCLVSYISSCPTCTGCQFSNISTCCSFHAATYSITNASQHGSRARSKSTRMAIVPVSHNHATHCARHATPCLGSLNIS
jgi:hypothetical protein